MWHVTHDMWHMTHDMSHMTHDMWHMWHKVETVDDMNEEEDITLGENRMHMKIPHPELKNYHSDKDNEKPSKKLKSDDVDVVIKKLKFMEKIIKKIHRWEQKGSEETNSYH